MPDTIRVIDITRRHGEQTILPARKVIHLAK